VSYKVSSLSLSLSTKGLTDRISSGLSGSECQSDYSATYSVLTVGRSHGELGRFTAHSLPLGRDEMRSAEMR